MTQEVVTTEDGKKVPANGSVAAWANANGVNVMAAEALHNKLRRLFNKPYIVAKPAADSIKEIINALENGQHIVLSFGEFETDLDYLLVSNLLTRKISEAWEKKTNAFRTTGKDEPRQLVIVVEEAHKLLNREMAAQTTFATIARELRKYYVTLLIIDQRPSQIYDEVMSQLGTRISGWLGDEDDIHAVLSGLSGREALRGMLARLQPKEEVLLLGWGVPMPLPVKSRRYDDEFEKKKKKKPGDGGADDVCDDRGRAAKILCDTAGDRPETVADLGRGDVAAGDAHLGLAGGRGRYPCGAIGAGGAGGVARDDRRGCSRRKRCCCWAGACRCRCR